jgi:glycosyltransferase involved in cell wall biosynthesis
MSKVLQRAKRVISRISRRIASRPGDIRRWLTLYRARPAGEGVVAVSYGRPLPPPEAPGRGGTVKFQRLSRVIPEAGQGFNVLYLGSSDRPDDLRQLIWLARRRGAAVVWNQDGVAYPGWAGSRTSAINRPLAHALHVADHVLYQSEFCRLSADRFLGEREGPSEVLYNAVDTTEFTPAVRPPRPLTLLLGGNQYQHYRVDAALRTLLELPDARLLVAGRLSFAATEREGRRIFDELAGSLGVGDRVELVGTYTQRDAPKLLRGADILLHTKYNDPCPSTVLEAMSCGLPIVFSASGGVPELVGADAGLGVPAPLDYERDHPPDPSALAERVRTVEARLDVFAAAARQRAVDRFDLGPWIEHHRRLFETLSG